MTDVPQHDQISLRQLAFRFRSFFYYLLSNYKLIIVSVVVAAVLGYLYTLRKPVYTAETTFSLEESSNMGQLSGLASMVGINVGALAEGDNSIFKGENIMELYTSRRMLEKTLLTEAETAGGKEKLVYRYIRERKLDKRWEGSPRLANINFDGPRPEFTRTQDSLLYEITDEIQEKVVAVDKPSRRLNIISVRVNSKDYSFAKLFNQELVKNVNEFYEETKTRKSAETVATLQHQADSIRKTLDFSVLEMASILESQPNINALNRTMMVPVQKKQIDVQASLAAYIEITKNLEAAKLNHLNKQPLIQIIDKPGNYLVSDKWKWYKGVVIGAFLGGVLCFAYLLLRYMTALALKTGDTRTG